MPGRPRRCSRPGECASRWIGPDGEPVVTVTLDRPATRNAQTPATWRALAAHRRRAARRRTGWSCCAATGPVFSSGIDLRTFTPEGVDGERILADDRRRGRRRGRPTSSPSSSAPSPGGTTATTSSPSPWCRAPRSAPGSSSRSPATCGCCSTAARFAMRETSLGLVPGPHRHPSAGARPSATPRALEICVTGRWVGADEALRPGLATAVVEPDDLDETVGDLVAALLAAPGRRRPRDQGGAARRRSTARRRRAARGWSARRRSRCSGGCWAPADGVAGTIGAPAALCVSARASPRERSTRVSMAQPARRPAVLPQRRQVRQGHEARRRARCAGSWATPRRTRSWSSGSSITLVSTPLLVVAQPLLFRRIIDQGVTPGNSAGRHAPRPSSSRCSPSSTAGLTLLGRWYSSRIGEGLIYDLRTQVYDHVQRMPVAFFTRAQTGALVSRLNNDVIGAQQAFTSHAVRRRRQRDQPRRRRRSR